MEKKTNKKDATSGGFFDLTHTNNYVLHVYSSFSVFFLLLLTGISILL